MKISILMASRRKGNHCSNLETCLNSLRDNASHLGNFEVLIKCDHDDTEGQIAVLEYAEANKNFALRYIITDRSDGYIDLHKAYIDLANIASPQCELFWILSDDILIGKRDWDKDILEAGGSRKGKPYVINTISDIQYAGLEIAHAVGYVDSYPVWSREWIAIAGFGFAFNTDGYTALLCREIETNYIQNRKVYRVLRDMKIAPIPYDNSKDDITIHHKAIADMVKLYTSLNMQKFMHIKGWALAKWIAS